MTLQWFFKENSLKRVAEKYQLSCLICLLLWIKHISQVLFRSLLSVYFPWIKHWNLMFLCTPSFKKETICYVLPFAFWSYAHILYRGIRPLPCIRPTCFILPLFWFSLPPSSPCFQDPMGRLSADALRQRSWLCSHCFLAPNRAEKVI